jgi:2-keto-4-pentenoate hydratase
MSPGAKYTPKHTAVDRESVQAKNLLAVDRLRGAATSGTPCAPVRDLIAAGDLDSAYVVQIALARSRIDAGARVVGRKVGLTNPKVQQQLGVERPDFGILLDEMIRAQNVPIDHTQLLQPRIEAEVAVVLASDLADDRLFTSGDIRAATGHVRAALEIVDSRIAEWDITIIDTVADNGSSGLFVLGDDEVTLGDLDLVTITMSMTRNDASGTSVVSSGTGADCLGDPLAAVAWLANEARDRGAPLRAGDVILSGALGPMVAVAPGDSFAADLRGLGTVTASFTPAEASS